MRLPVAGAAGARGAVHARPFVISCLPPVVAITYNSFSLSRTCALACAVSSAWDPLFPSEKANENPCSPKGLLSKSSFRVQDAFQNSLPIPRQLFWSLVPGGVTAPTMPWDGVATPTQPCAPKVRPKAKFCHLRTHPLKLPGRGLSAKSQGKRKLWGWGGRGV